MTELEEAFWSHVVDGPLQPHMQTPCRVWTGTINTDGYGHWTFRGVRYLVHRLAWQFQNGAIPDGMLVRHECDNPPCVLHLLIGTDADNMRDKVARGRHHYKKRTHCKHDHELTADNVYMWRGARLCRTCLRENQRKTQARKRARVAP